METFDGDDEFKQCFLDEASELISSIEQCFLCLEKRPNDLDNLNQIFRFAHNLKGSSGAVGFDDLAEFTHKLESLLVELKEERVPVTSAIVDLLLRTNDYLSSVMVKLRADTQARYRNPELLDELTRALSGDPSQQIASMQSASTAAVHESESDQDQELTFSAAGSSAPSSPSSPQAEVKEENIRVGLSRINELINNVGELVIYQSVLQQQSLVPGVTIPPLMRATLAAMKKIIQSTRDLSMGLRMLPIKQTFQKMQRIVRDTSKSLGKDVELHLVGEDTEVDKTVLEQIADPLVHLVRNAVDHGLESSEERITAGKSPTGHVFLSAYHKAGHVVIEIKEDGRGLDHEKLVRIAKSKGLIPESASPSPDQAYQLIFAPGFSTKTEVTDVSGRGVGMDVVKTNITRLQGQIEIETSLGKGTCFRIFLPLTLAIVDGIVVRLGEERYVVPLSQVSEFFRPRSRDINLVFGKTEILTLREETLPTYRLSQLLRRGVLAETGATELTALIVRDQTHGSFAVFVDEVVAQSQIVIKPLGEELKGKAGYMGSAILGDGRPALILDLQEMAKRHKSGTSSQKNHTKTMEVA